MLFNQHNFREFSGAFVLEASDLLAVADACADNGILVFLIVGEPLFFSEQNKIPPAAEIAALFAVLLYEFYDGGDGIILPAVAHGFDVFLTLFVKLCNRV